MSEKKTIDINGQHNRYLIKKANLHKNKATIRNNFIEHNELIDISFISMLKMNIENNVELSDIQRYIKGNIDKKLNSYCSQDKKMKRYDSDTFISLNEVLIKLICCQNKCYYCNDNIIINYKYSREQKQWSLERKNNNIQHNNENCVIACLECNLKRKNTNYDAFQFTKQMKIIKKTAKDSNDSNDLKN